MRLRNLLAILMAISVTHTTPADASFSAAGASAWDATHTVTGALTLEDVYPVGSVYTSVRTTNPGTIFGFGTWAFLGEGQVLVGLATGTPAFNTVRATGGALTAASSGTVSTPTFTGDSYEPSGSNAISLTREAVAGANAASLTRDEVSGVNAITLFREAVAGTNAASSVLASISNTWPTDVPTYAGTAHQHGIPMVQTGATGITFLGNPWGKGEMTVGLLRVSATTTGPIVRATGATGTGTIALSQTASSAGIISWPATAPIAGIVSATAKAQIFTGVTGSVSGPVFTGVTASVSAQVFTGVTASVSGQVFTGVGKAPTGSVSKPTYVGDETSIVQPYFVVCFWERTA